MKTGDLVVHMTGGYLMTVVKIRNDMIECRWFDSELFLCQRKFRQNTLIPVQPITPQQSVVCGVIKGSIIRKSV